jgi:ABC-type polysaccharide/polyol phosphate transport system ATPase subunit
MGGGRLSPAASRDRAPAIVASGITKMYRRMAPGFQLRTLKSALLEGSLVRGLSPEEAIVALSDVSFTVQKGEAFGLIGSNGSGKSTLLKLVAGMLRPDAGTVAVDGRVAALIELGAGFHPEISGRENVYINGAVLGLSRRELDARFDSIVEFSGLEDFIDEPVKTYSSGMYVRLGFAVAIHTAPDVLLVDEVLAVGDEAFAHRCLRKIEELLASGRTLLLVSHSLSLMEGICDRVLWLDGGKAPSGRRAAARRRRLSRGGGGGRGAAAPRGEGARRRGRRGRRRRRRARRRGRWRRGRRSAPPLGLAPGRDRRRAPAGRRRGALPPRAARRSPRARRRGARAARRLRLRRRHRHAARRRGVGHQHRPRGLRARRLAGAATVRVELPSCGSPPASTCSTWRCTRATARPTTTARACCRSR